MNALGWIVVSGVLMSIIAMVGSVTLIMKPATLDRLLLPSVAFAAGSLIGGAFFHMIPAAIVEIGDVLNVGIAVVAGFTAFFLLEQLLHWHHCHRACSGRPRSTAGVGRLQCPGSWRVVKTKGAPIQCIVGSDILARWLGGLRIVIPDRCELADTFRGR